MLLFVAGVDSGAGWNANSNIGSRIGILSEFFIGNNLLLKLLRTFSKNQSYVFEKKIFFEILFISLSKFFNWVANYLCLLSASFNDKYPSCISLKKQ